jgi:hypothetical protein
MDGDLDSPNFRPNFLFFSKMVVWAAPIPDPLELKGIGTASLKLISIGTDFQLKINDNQAS